MIPKIYLDACPLIEMAQFAALPKGANESVGVWYCRQALRAAREGEVVVTTSILSVSECTSIG